MSQKFLALKYPIISKKTDTYIKFLKNINALKQFKKYILCETIDLPGQ